MGNTISVSAACRGISAGHIWEKHMCVSCRMGGMPAHQALEFRAEPIRPALAVRKVNSPVDAVATMNLHGASTRSSQHSAPWCGLPDWWHQGLYVRCVVEVRSSSRWGSSPGQGRMAWGAASPVHLPELQPGRSWRCCWIWRHENRTCRLLEKNARDSGRSGLAHGDMMGQGRTMYTA